MWIKICGTTNLEDAQLAASLGADALGFVFAPSRRQVTAAQVAAITPHLPPTIERVGVFTTQSPAEIASTVSRAGLTAVQLHGSPSDPETFSPPPNPSDRPRQLHDLLPAEIRIIQTLSRPVPQEPGQSSTSPTPEPTFPQQLAALTQLPCADRILVDSRVGSASGGTGIPFDWAAARSALSALPPHIRLILAGGLTPENVSEAISILNPYGVDVVTGVEASPGHKDAKKLAAFFRNARA